MALYPIAGSKIFIGGPGTRKDTVALSDFTGESWVEIDGWVNAGPTGDTQNVGTQSVISSRRVRKFKTTINGGTMENQFIPMALDAGQVALKAAVENCGPYKFKIEWGADCSPEAVVTFSIADPGTVNWASHGLQAGQPVIFTNEGGALPAALTAGTVYYVIAAGLTAGEFSVAATPGGTGIEFVGAGTGTSTASAPPLGMTDFFEALALPGQKSGGDAEAALLRTWTLDITSNTVEV